MVLGAYLLWGFDMSAALTGWTALRLASGIFMFRVAYDVWKHHREIQQGLHQWPAPSGRFYDEWLNLPIDRPHADYYTWLAELKDWRDPWATWAREEQRPK